jgi:nitroreductase
MDLKTVDKLLTTTRTVRKRLDFERPVPPEIIMECLNLAIQAPTGGNSQGWRFLVVTDSEKKARIGELYAKSFFIYAKEQQANPPAPGEARAGRLGRVASSATYLARNMHRAPALVIPCINGRVENAGQMNQAGLYGSILPAAWSFMLALRARGLGAAWTTLHLRYADQIAELLGIPDDITQAALLPVAYFKGEDFKPAKRVPAEEITWWNQWGKLR